MERGGNFHFPFLERAAQCLSLCAGTARAPKIPLSEGNKDFVRSYSADQNVDISMSCIKMFEIAYKLLEELDLIGIFRALFLYSSRFDFSQTH